LSQRYKSTSTIDAAHASNSSGERSKSAYVKIRKPTVLSVVVDHLDNTADSTTCRDPSECV